ncbi:MAG: TIGR03663 family protein [Anaerolineae bacterium]|nr:TIGR03663 family protein [Thermoflexales bacterium]MDW8396598.1 TIGR03663 family protein [Anaerolineae bacterium]
MTVLEDNGRVERWLSQPVLGRLSAEHVAYLVLIALAMLSRFYDLGARVMSHDESLHTYFSYQLANGRGFQHTPLMHGPFLFHITALSYFLFGADDFTSRLPMAVFGVVLVALPFAFRRWLGRAGALGAALMLLISPSILYHARYIRQEESILVWTVLTALCLWRYLDDRQPGWLVGLSAVLAFHATDKSTSFLVVAWVLIFLAPLAVKQVIALRGQLRDALTLVGLTLLTAVLMVGLSLAFERISALFASVLGMHSLVQPGNPAALDPSLSTLLFILLMLVLTALVTVVLITLYQLGFGLWLQQVHQAAPALNAAIVLVTTTMFMGSPAMLLIKNRLWELFQGEELVPISLLGDMANLQSNPRVITTMFAMALALIAIAVALGLVWGGVRWLTISAVFLAITVTLFTTVFTNPAGIGTGFVGQLGYWMAQQPVQRGGQPWYYYFLIVPMYEYTALIGSACAGVVLGGMLIRHVRRTGESLAEALREYRFQAFLVWWAVASWAVYTIAGEKMPWLTTHIALPMCLLTGWFLGKAATYLSQTMRGQPPLRWAAALGLGLVAVTLVVRMLSLIGGLSLEAFDSEAVNWGLGMALTLGLLGFVLLLLRQLVGAATAPAFGLASFAVLSALTVRTAVMVTYINYDYVKEFLFYAHGAPGVKIALRQMEDLRDRMGGSDPLRIGYTQQVSWPFSWYMVHFPGARYIGAALPTDYESLHVILASEQDTSFLEISERLRDQYARFDYTLVWWPMQDYFDLTWERISYSLFNPEARAALWEIAFNRNFEPYARLFNKPSLTPERWSPSHRFSMFVRADLVERLWDYQLGDLAANGIPRQRSLRLQSPTGVAVAPNGERLIVDHRANRVFRQAADGALLSAFGGAGNGPGQFNDPWGIAVDRAGNIYVADTFNHRVQKFTPEGVFLLSWGQPGVSNEPGEGKRTLFFGPRGIAFDRQGRVLVTDTGNKRVQVFDTEGNFLTQFGAPGDEPGQFNEPVGIAVDERGLIYVADVWNRRVQVFDESFAFVRAWTVPKWAQMPIELLQAVDHKPYIAVADNRVFVSSPRTGQVFAFTPAGTRLDLPDLSLDAAEMPTGLAVHDGQLLVASQRGSVLVLPLEAEGGSQQR